MPDAIIYPNTVMIHAQNTSFTNTAVMCTRRFIIRALLAIPQVPSLAFDLMNRILGVFNIGNIRGRDPPRILRDGASVVENAHSGNASEDDGVHDARGGHQAEPTLDKNEDRAEVNEGDCRNYGRHVKREAAASLHCGCSRGDSGERRRHRILTMAPPGRGILIFIF